MILTNFRYIRRLDLRTICPALLKKFGFADRVLLFLFLFPFLLSSQMALSNLRLPNMLSASEANLDSAFYAQYPYVIVINDGDDIEISDDDFYRNAASVIFKVSKYDLPTEDATLNELRDKVLPQIRRDGLRVVRVKLRGAASPEGSEEFNRYLSEQRQMALYNFIRDDMQIPQGDSLMFETETEGYSYLYRKMKQNNDPDFEKVKPLFDEYMPGKQYAQLKKALRTVDGGRVWQRMLVTYYPSLRSACMLIVCQRDPALVQPIAVEPIEAIEPISPVEPIEPVVTPVVPEIPVEVVVPDTLEEKPWVERYPRRELLSVKTNLLFYGVYMPGYNRWCPIPNVAVEYYPLRGHFTFGASFDCPWWQNYWAHKYFQIRNYQLEARYYFRKGDIELRPEGKGAAFKGFYLQAYGHMGLFGICFDENRGWVGEGGGGGIGAGYVMPLSKKGHWRLEFQLQVGVFHCKYDPYQFENPVDPDFRDHLYYYKWTGKPSLFKERQYRFTWVGPTRVGITLSYDLLYRKARKKTEGVRMPEGTEPTKRYNRLVPYEKEMKGGRQ